MASRTVDQLQVVFADSGWRKAFVDFCDLMELLGDCTIPNSYVVSDELNAAIKLSDDGNKLLNRLVRQKVSPKDARLMCALTLGHDELFVDIDATDIDKLAAAIDAGLKKGLIRFPFIYGRDLYDAYAELFEDEREFLSNEETLRLLDKLFQGVFQYGNFTVGPYGIHRSSQARKVSANRRVSGYHCSSPACPAIHPISLQTGSNAPINRERDKLDEILQSFPEKASEWWAFASELSGGASHYYGDQQIAVLLPLIGDVLSDGELQKLVADLFDGGTNGELRKAVRDFLTVESSQAAVESMNRAQLLQLTLLATEDDVASSLDRLVRAGDIKVPRGDVRKPVVNRNVRSGAFRLHAELGHHGVRFVSDDPGLALLRERRLLSKLYVRDPGTDVQELEWQLRGIDIDDLDEKLQYFYRTKSPADALKRLALARKSNMIAACYEVRIDHDNGMTDDELIDTFLWKLGFPNETDEDPHADFWELHQRISALTQSLTSGSSERFLESAALYFTHLEGLLLDSLAFTSWALQNDHTRSASPFAYDDDEDRDAGLALLESARISASKGDKQDVDYTSGRVDLRNLMEGFALLAKHLERCRTSPEIYKRPVDEMPEFDGKTDLKRYLLRSTLPFLDLSRPSQDRIIDGLKFITKTMVSVDVNQVRNDYMHYRRTPPEIARIEEALDATRQSVAKIENLGFCRLLFSPASVAIDRWEQRTHGFVGPRSYEHFFTRPTTLDWMGLPGLNSPQYLLRAASFDDPNEVLRFTRRYRSEFSEMWIGFPNRRRRGPGLPAAEEQPAHQSEVETSLS